MTNIIIGSGIVGLTIAWELKNNRKYKDEEIIIVDKNNIPSKGTSIKNSGVLHSGIYYKSKSLKAKLCINGSKLLKEFCNSYDLPLNECGKILIPFSDIDKKRLMDIYSNGKENGCEVQLIDKKYATRIQPGIIDSEVYLWSPRTAVFSPIKIIDQLYNFLKEKKVTFIKSNVIDIDDIKNVITLSNGIKFEFKRFFNAAGAGSLEIASKVTNKFRNLDLLPILGQYGFQSAGQLVKTNLYPVPDPCLPFLGIHLTPTTENKILVGPNAIPSLKQDIQSITTNDAKKLLNRLFYHATKFTFNSDNYRKHALSELCLITEAKFRKKGKSFFAKEYSDSFNLEMTKETYGVRAQLLDKENLKFIDDFIYENINGNLHVINAVSPAFTSSFALAKYIISSI